MIRLMVQKSGSDRLGLVVYAMIHRFLYMPGGSRWLFGISAIYSILDSAKKNERLTWNLVEMILNDFDSKGISCSRFRVCFLGV